MSNKTPDKLFEKAAFGYRHEDVDRHIDQLNARIRALEAEKQELLEKMKILAEKINEYRQEESALRDALLDAYTSYRELELTDGERDLTATEKATVKAECDALTERCEKEAAICSS